MSDQNGEIFDLEIYRRGEYVFVTWRNSITTNLPNGSIQVIKSWIIASPSRMHALGQLMAALKPQFTSGRKSLKNKPVAGCGRAAVVNLGGAEGHLLHSLPTCFSLLLLPHLPIWGANCDTTHKYMCRIYHRVLLVLKKAHFLSTMLFSCHNLPHILKLDRSMLLFPCLGCSR